MMEHRKEALAAAGRIQHGREDAQLCAGVVTLLLTNSPEQAARVKQINDTLDGLADVNELNPDWAVQQIRWLLDDRP